jgi:acyl carrier protein
MRSKSYLYTPKNKRMDNLKEQLKKQIIEVLNMEGVTPADIKDDATLFGGGLGLDSIDALELIVMLEHQYKIKIANPEEGKAVFESINSLADFVTQKTK